MSAVDSPARPPSIRRRERPDPERRTVERRRIDGTVIDTVILAPEIFGIVPNTAVLHQVVTAQLAAARAGTQSTRTRAEVARRWGQAVPPEGHGPGPPGLDPLAAVGRAAASPSDPSPARTASGRPRR